MTTTTKLVAAALLAGGLLATTGFGLTQGPGDGPAVKPDAPAKPDVLKAPLTDQAIRAALAKPCPIRPAEGITLGVLLQQIAQEYGVIIRFDLAAYKRLYSKEIVGDGDNRDPSAADIKKLHESKLGGDYPEGVSLADILTGICADLPGRHSYRVRNGQILIGPAFHPPAIPGRANDRTGDPFLEQRRLLEQTHGEPVSLAIEEKPFQDAIKELRRLTGANIVVNVAADKMKDKLTPVSVTFDDVRLYTALEILGDMAGLKLVYVNNIYYLTSPESAEKLQNKVNEETYGRDYKPLTVPAGYLTDGINYYRNPGSLKPENPDDPRGIFGGTVPTLPAPVRCHIFPQPPSANRYEPSYCSGHTPFGTNAPAVM